MSSGPRLLNPLLLPTTCAADLLTEHSCERVVSAALVRVGRFAKRVRLADLHLGRVLQVQVLLLQRRARHHRPRDRVLLGEVEPENVILVHLDELVALERHLLEAQLRRVEVRLVNERVRVRVVGARPPDLQEHLVVRRDDLRKHLKKQRQRSLGRDQVQIEEPLKRRRTVLLLAREHGKKKDAPL